MIGKIDIVDARLALPETPNVPLPPEGLSRDPAVVGGVGDLPPL